MSKLQEIKKHLRPGQVYRREDLAKWSNAVDRHLKQLQEEGKLTKLSGGLYYCPKKTVFGNTPADDRKLVEAFLRDHRFLLTSPNAYNSLGLGTTQLYNETIVYNHKRHGRFELGGRTFEFRVKPRFPMRLTTEFLLVDMVNNLDALAEDTSAVLERVKKKLPTFRQVALMRCVQEYGSIRTKKFFALLIGERAKK
ncbi:MAG: hypothetical protein ABL867_07450 [Rickettsiales bacterium]